MADKVWVGQKGNNCRIVCCDTPLYVWSSCLFMCTQCRCARTAVCGSGRHMPDSNPAGVMIRPPVQRPVLCLCMLLLCQTHSYLESEQVLCCASGCTASLHSI